MALLISVGRLCRLARTLWTAGSFEYPPRRHNSVLKPLHSMAALDIQDRGRGSSVSPCPLGTEMELVRVGWMGTHVYSAW